MSDVMKELSAIGRFTVPEPTPAAVAADVRRGTRALARRRLRWVSGVAVVTLCLGGEVIRGDRADESSPSAREATSAASTRPAVPVALVAYRGRQAPGFDVATVPRGFVLQGVSGSVLAIARPGDTTPIDTFVDKLVVTVSPADEAGPPTGEPVTVGGARGAIRRSDDGTATLSFVSGSRLLEVQAWKTVGLDDQQLVTFAEGVTVTASAQDSHG